MPLIPLKMSEKLCLEKSYNITKRCQKKLLPRFHRDQWINGYLTLANTIKSAIEILEKGVIHVQS